MGVQLGALEHYAAIIAQRDSDALLPVTWFSFCRLQDWSSWVLPPSLLLFSGGGSSVMSG